MEERYLTTREAAEYLRLGTQTLYNWRFRGEGPPYRKFGRAIRYALSDLQKFAEARRVDPQDGEI